MKITLRQRIGGKYAITFRAWIILLPWSFWVSSGFSPSGKTYSFSTTLLLAFLSHSATGLVWLVARYSFLRANNRRPRFVLTLLTYLISGVARSVTMGFSTVSLGLEVDPAYLNRIPSGSILVLVWASFVTVLVDSRKRQLDVIRELEKSNSQLISTQEKSIETLKVYTAEVFAKTNIIIQNSFSAISKSVKFSPNRDSSQISKALYDLVDDVVRPLSHDIVLSKTKLEVKIDNQNLKPSWAKRFNYLRNFVNDLTLVQPFGTQITPWVVMMTGLPIFAIYSTPFETLVFVLAVLSTAFVGFELANRFLRVFLFKTSLPLRVFLVLAIWISAAIAAGYICSFLPGVKEIIPQMALTFTGIMFLSALFSSLLMAQRESLKVLEKELTSTNASISWYIDRLNQSLSVEKKRISLLLHGDIQSQIVSVALNLQNKPNLEQNNLEVILENLQSSCVEALTVENKGTDPGAILESIVQVWRSNVQINLNYSIETLNRLKFDSIATVSAVEIVREVISNAVKHGKSSKIKINLEIDLDSNLQIEVQNNGLDYLPRKQAGLGTVVFNELTRKWSIQNTEGGVIFTGTVALAH